jgi:two-component system CheB/CheR fusion protein
VVGVGASAGGLDACQRLLRGAPADQGMAFVIVLHLAPAEQSHVAEILQRATVMEVTQVTGRERVEPNHVYVIAPATSLGIRRRRLEAGAPEEPHYRARPIDAFFSALAVDQKDAAVAIVLSGTGADGSAGLREVGAAGGLCLVQEPATAEFDGMPRRAIDTGAADAILAPEEMGTALLRYAATPRVRPTREPDRETDRETDEPAEGLEAILELLGGRFRVGFRDYKTGTLRRRTQHRMGLLHLSSWQDYLEHLRAQPAEADELYRDLLIGVTSFFRDAEEWELLAREILPALIEKKERSSAVRVWSAGCATGEEAYSLAMVLLERPEIAEGSLELKVFASDASDAALAVARQGRYPAGIEEQVSADRLRRFFRPLEGGFEAGRTLRGAVTFAAHDLLSDPVFAHLDLVSCRNVLIYLEPEAQERLLERFHFALRPEGALWLGASETIGRRTDLFEAVSGQHRFYRPLGVPRNYRYHRPHRAAEAAPVHSARDDRAPTATELARLAEKLVLQRYSSPSVVIDQGLEILHFFGPTDEFLTRPHGEARLDLLSWVRPELYAKLRAGLAEAVEHKQRVTVTGIRLERADTIARVEIVIEPIGSAHRAGGRFLVVFQDRPVAHEPSPAAAEGEGDDEALAGQLRRELDETREELRTAVEQLRTMTEEHGARYEEILSLNEEFQSSNEELEASKEELQSLNEELTTMNRQLEQRNDELRSLTSLQERESAASEYARLYAEAIIRTSRTCLLVLDMDHRVLSANAAFYSTFLIDQEATVGRRLYDLDDGGWDIPDLRSLLDEVVAGRKEIRDYDLDHAFERIGWRSLRLNADMMTRNGRPDLILVSIEDVTDLRKAEMVARSRSDELVRDDRSKNEFLAVLGHELRNPLSALTSGLDLIRLTGGGSVEPIRAMMERQARRMTAMLDQLLDVARVIAGKFELEREAADLAEAARAAIESVQPMLAKAGHELAVSLPPAGSALVLGDAVRLAQVIENLLGNAAKFTESGGRIWLTVEGTEDTIRLAVRDSGIGMEPAVLENAFDMFAQAPSSLRRARGGLGIGLPLVRHLVRMHGGAVDAFSAGAGQGTEVVVTLPRLRSHRPKPEPKPEPEPIEQRPAEPHPIAHRRILVVDDEEDAAQALVEILSLHGHEARRAPDRDGALAVAAELDPEVVLLDLGLPGVDGYQVARELRELLGRKPFLLALTGYQDDRARLEEAGFDGHLLKPTDLAELFARLADPGRGGEAASPPEPPVP